MPASPRRARRQTPPAASPAVDARPQYYPGDHVFLRVAVAVLRRNFDGTITVVGEGLNRTVDPGEIVGRITPPLLAEAGAS